MESADSDWAVTCIIYAQETSGSALRLDEAAGVVRAETTVSVDSKGILLMALRADGIHEFTVEPRFPLLKLVVEYAPNDLFTPVAAYVEDADLKVRKSHLFHPDWMEWINAELVNLIAATEPSSSILEFIMHDSLRFIEPVGTIESDIGTLSVLRHDDMWLRPQAGTFTVSKEEHIYCSFDTASLLPQPDSVQDLFSPSASGKGKISSRQPEQSRIQNLVRQLRLSVCHILPFECAICFDKCLSADATRLFCGHVFCTECIQHYLAITMRELARPKWRHSYPFVCPNAGCSQTINLAYDQTLTRLLSKKDIQKFMDVAALGDVMAFIAKGQAPARKPSRALSITSCPRTGCRKKSMMSFENTTLVFCDFCSRTWCERCLSRVTEHHPSDECSPLFAVDLVRRRLLTNETRGCVLTRPGWRVIFKHEDGLHKTRHCVPTAGLASKKQKAAITSPAVNVNHTFVMNAGRNFQRTLFTNTNVQGIK
ncbi:hypothetical protein HDU83_002018 [Entophlyctis luteolus]|nr:hypothetical protein HDU83_002018 [Entophlyctis luteolus]